jgi:hypothetical protein
MKIHISTSDLKPSVRKLYLGGKIKHMVIDYAPNSIMGWVDSEEIEVFNFSNVCRMDNRFSSYELTSTESEIVIEITKL